MLMTHNFESGQKEQTVRIASETVDLARRFFTVGGWLIISPDGDLEAAGDLRFMRSQASDEEYGLGMSASGEMCLALRDWRKRQIEGLVKNYGTRLENGWLVLKDLPE